MAVPQAAGQQQTPEEHQRRGEHGQVVHGGLGDQDHGHRLSAEPAGDFLIERSQPDACVEHEHRRIGALEAEGYRESEIRCRRSADLRYVGQAYELTVPAESSELEAGTLSAFAEREVFFKEAGLTPCQVYGRAKLPAGATIEGPAIVEDASSTIVVYPGRSATVTEWDTITLRSGA